ncbi:uncharacterized protein G2W53_039303 [Senna tora]|uniref:Uncharacterized protein n=1 Tax=Senna tora TaxID=362788 RepID=A0A834W2Q4_9FABA|nr:uncharacterized protein G2W53_039303 [Senna tora]
MAHGMCNVHHLHAATCATFMQL